MADRLVGMAFGVVRGAAIVCALYLGVGILIEPDQQPSWMTRAALLPYVREGAGMLQDLLPADAEEAGREAVREARREVERELISP
jgi:membrane protein required for colicin V production